MSDLAKPCSTDRVYTASELGIQVWSFSSLEELFAQSIYEAVPEAVELSEDLKIIMSGHHVLRI